MNAVIQGLIIIIIGIGGCLSYFYLSNLLLEKVLFPPRGENAGRNINRANMIRPWLFSFPVIFMMGVYIVYPIFETLRLSLTDRDLGDAFVGLANYQQLFNDTKFWEAMRNNLLWLIVVPATCTAFGPPDRRTDRPHCLGQHRQVDLLHAHGDLVCRLLGGLHAVV